MRWPWQQKPERKSMVLGTSDALGAFLMFGDQSGANPSSALLLYEQSTAVSVPVNMVADYFSVLDPVLMIGDKRIADEDAPVIQLLKKPSPYFSTELFLEMLSKDFLITGECEVIALGGVNRPPLELQPISPKVVTVTQGANGLVGQFFITGSTLTGTYLPKRVKMDVRYFDGGLREFKQIRAYSTKNNSLLRGQSRLVAASREAKQHILGTQHNVSLLERGGRLSLIFHFDQDMDDEDFEETKKRVREQYGGATKAGEVGITAGGKLAIHEAGISNRDMDYANLQKIAQQSCALQYHVPLPLITAERQTMNNYREAKLALFDDAVIPLSKVIFGGLSDMLLPRYGLDPTQARITFDPDQVSALVMRRNEELKLRSSIGVESDNEIRAMLGREPYEGGDVILKPSTLIPAGSDLFLEDNAPEIQESLDD